jgi:hypothetical protein
LGISFRNRILDSLLFVDDQIIFAQDENDVRYKIQLIEGYKNGD